MRTRALGATAAAVLLASLSAAGQSKPGAYKVPRTPWGEPDLQGTYNARDLQGVALERAASLGTRDTLNDEEFSQRVATRDEALAHDNSDEFTLEHAAEWEGDTLVVETRNLRRESMINREPLSPEGALIERFTLADANTLDYRLTVVDPKTWTAPWTVRLPIARDNSYALYEYACHEGNYAMSNLLSGSRAEEKRREVPSR
jgi:hypothetical protein